MGVTSEERLALVIETSKRGDALLQVTQQMTAASETAVRASQRITQATQAEAAATQKLGAMVSDATMRRIQAEAKSTLAARAAAQAQREAMTAEQAGTEESIRLLALKARAVNVADLEAVTALKQEIQLEQEHQREIGQTEEQYLRMQLVIQGLEKRMMSATMMAEKMDMMEYSMANRLNGIPAGKIQTAANAMSSLSFAAQSAAAGGQSVAVAMGNVASSLALVANGAQFALWATGIGAVVTITAALVSVLHQAAQAAEPSQRWLEHIEHMNLTQARSELQQLRAEMDKEQEAAVRAAIAHDFWWRMLHRREEGVSFWEDILDTLGLSNEALRTYEGTLRKVEKLTKDVSDMEAQRRKELAQMHRELDAQSRQQLASLARELTLADLRAGGVSDTRLQLQQLAQENRERAEAIEKMFTMRDGEGHLVALTADEVRARARLLEQNDAITDAKRRELEVTIALQNAEYRRGTAALSTSPDTLYQTRLAEIDAAKDAAIKAGVDEVEAERRRQAEIQKLRRETLQKTVGYFGELTAVLMASGSRQVKAVGHAAESIRRVWIGAEGAYAGVMALREGAAALRAAGDWDFRGAALHAASAVQYAATAAKAGQEALGGGGGAGSGGGGGAGGPVFEPNRTGGRGDLVLNVITRNPYGPDSIETVRWELDRSEKFDRPLNVRVPPTNGVTLGAA